jgi:predicted nicotinamide N-methyase
MDELSPAILPHQYETTRDTIVIGDERLVLHMVLDTAALIDRIAPASFAVDERFPYWAELWASAIGLAHTLQRMDLRGFTVLELGCGLGLCGIMAVRRGARVMMTDYEHDALAFASANAAANLTTDERARMTLRLLDWRATDVRERFDLVIGADIVYERRNFAPLLTLLPQVLARNGRVMLADPDRTIGADFIAAAKTDGWNVVTERTTVPFKGIPVTVAHHTLSRTVSPPAGD